MFDEKIHGYFTANGLKKVLGVLTENSKRRHRRVTLLQSPVGVTLMLKIINYLRLEKLFCLVRERAVLQGGVEG